MRISIKAVIFSKKIRPWFPILGLFASALALQLAARLVPGFGQWYAVSVYPLITGSLGRLAGLSPFCLSELGLYVLIPLIVISAFRFWRRPFILLRRACLLASALLFLFTANCGVNYYRQPFSALSGLKIRPSTKEELYDLCFGIVLEIQNSAGQLKEEASGQSLIGQRARDTLPSFRQLRD